MPLARRFVANPILIPLLESKLSKLFCCWGKVARLLSIGGQRGPRGRAREKTYQSKAMQNNLFLLMCLPDIIVLPFFQPFSVKNASQGTVGVYTTKQTNAILSQIV